MCRVGFCKKHCQAILFVFLFSTCVFCLFAILERSCELPVLPMLCDLRSENLYSLMERCRKVGLAVLDVPADGNCMVWSLRHLRDGVTGCNENYKSKAAIDSMMSLRRKIASGWLAVKDIKLWQRLWRAFCEDHLPKENPQTPKKKSSKTKEKDAGEKLATPPRPDPPAKEGLKRAEGAKPIPVASRKLPPSPTLLKPQQKRLRRHQEPEMPDLEEAFHNIMQKGNPQDLQEDPAELRVDQLDESGLVGDDVFERKRKSHTRVVTKPKEDKDTRMKDLVNYLAEKHYFTYESWRSAHRAQAKLKKSWVCTEKGWLKLKGLLYSGSMPACEGCLAAMQEKDVTLDLCASVLEGRLSLQTGEAGDTSFPFYRY